MSLLWPGDHRAGDAMSDDALLDGMARCEAAWSAALHAAGIAPAGAVVDAATLRELAPSPDDAGLQAATERAGNPVGPFVSSLRAALPEPAATWLHRGLTSQDVLDTALVLGARSAVTAVCEQVDRQLGVLAGLIDEHRDTPVMGRTLTQHAVPITFGDKASGWARGLLDALDDLSALRFPAQCAGAAGTSAALVELGDQHAAQVAREQYAAALDLDLTPPWHTVRTPVTRIADAVTRCGDAWGHLAADVLLLGRPEVGELSDTSGGTSSTMPGKANPTAAVLLRRFALTAPQQAASVHLAAADQVDERADGAWHAEWLPFALLLRHAVVAAHEASDLLDGLQVHAAAMSGRVGGDAPAEQAAMADLAGRPARTTYRGLSGETIEQTLHRIETRRRR